MDLAHDITTEDLQAFLQEANEHLQLLDEDIVRLEREQANPELLQEIFRAAHTLKGSSAMLGHQRMAELAHSMESVLDRVRKGDLPITTQVVDALLHSLDALQMLKEELVSSEVSELDIAATVAELERVLKGDAVPPVTPVEPQADEKKGGILPPERAEQLQSLVASGQTAYQIRVTLRQDTAWAAVRCFQALELLAELGEVVGSTPTQQEVEAERVGHELTVIFAGNQTEDSIRHAIGLLDEIESVEIVHYVIEEHLTGALEITPARDEAAPADDAGARQRNQGTQTVRIDVERLDHLMNMIGELVIDRTRIVQIGKALESKYREDDLVQALGKTSAHIEKVVDELQESTMKVRMLPIGTVFSGFPRMIRDLAQKINKKVNFVVDGQDTEIDRTVIDRIRDPLVHLLRNAVDHGLEDPDQRRAAGKPEAGTIRLAAYHEQGHIVITVNDDGKGIDPRKVRDAVVNKGIISADVASRLTDAECVDLIFLPGVSTAAKTTDISGRGVGLDIVKSNIEAINGFVNVETRGGQGTKFTLKLPLTLATLHALLVSVNDTIYAIPLVYVLEAVVRQRHEINRVEANEVVRLRGNVVPLIRLSDALKIGVAQTNRPDQTWIVVVKFGERLVGLGVDALIELQEIVVKSLGKYIGDVKGVAGASILGDGQVVLILDVASLMNLVIQKANIKNPREYAMQR